MLSKALWYKNYKQAKFACWAFIVCSLLVPFSVYSLENQLETTIERSGALPDGLYIDFFSTASLFQLLVLVLLAALLVGAERNNYHYEFSLSLPFTRESIFLSKWLGGVAVIIVGVTLAVLLTLFLFTSSVYLKEFINSSLFFTYWWGGSLLLIAVYSFALMLGYMTGNVISQIGLSLITLILPAGLYHLIHQFFVHHSIYIDHPLWWNLRALAEFTTIPLVLLEFGQSYVLQGMSPDYGFDQLFIGSIIILGLSYMVTTFLVTLWLCKYSKVEQQGKIMLFKPLEHVLKAGVFVCFFLLGGVITGDSGRGSQLVSYYIGAVIFAAIAYFILTKLLSLKLSIGKQ